MYTYVHVCNYKCSLSYYIFIDPEDYANRTYQAVFAPDERNAQIKVPINDNKVCERDEEFVMMLYIPEESAVYGVRAGTRRKATVTIKDDDSKLTNSACMCALVCTPLTHTYTYIRSISVLCVCGIMACTHNVCTVRN